MNITVDRAVIEQALEALETVRHKIDSYQLNVCDDVDEAITALRTALEQPEQEPVAFKDAPERIYLQACEDDHCEVSFREHDEITWCAEQQNPLDVPYVRADLAVPHQRKPLSDEELDSIIENWWRDDLKMKYEELARAIEAAHGIKE